MAFKTVDSYNEARFGGFFLLRNDGDYADVIFMYRSREDVLVADTHYIKSADYQGYVHCCGRGCPACQKGIRVQTKLFIPLYNISEGKIEFWDRTMRFEPQLMNDVFKNFANPSEYVFRVTRHGAAGSIDTTYEIQAISRNNVMSYADILASNNVTSPEYYSEVCKEVDSFHLSDMLNERADNVSTPSTAAYSANLPDYQIKPRAVATTYTDPALAIEIPDDTDASLESLDEDDVNF